MQINFLRIESYKKGIVVSSAFNFFSKLLLFLQSIAIAYFFGTQAKTDVYFYCFVTIMLVATFINSLDSSVLIPESMRLSEQNSKEESMTFLNFFIYVYFAIGLTITLIFYINPVYIFQLLSSFDKEVLQENLYILLAAIPLFTLIVVTTLLVNILTSHKFFTIPMIAGMVNSIFSLLFIFLFHKSLDVLSILIGLLCAYLINILSLIYLMKRRLNWNFSFSFYKIERNIFKNIIFAQAGNITSALSAYIPIYLLSGFGAGIITSLTYGQRTADMPGQLITTQFSSVVGIKFNELYAKHDFERLNEIFLSTLKFLLFILSPISALIFLYSEEIITIFFKRGAFDMDSVNASAQFLKYFGLLLPFLAVNVMVSRLFMAGQKIKQAFGYQIIFNVILIIFIFFGIRHWGVIGYPISLIALHIFNVFMCYFLLKMLFPMIVYTDILMVFIKILLINIILFFFVFYLKGQFDNLNIIVNLALGCIIYVLILLLFNLISPISSDINKILYKIKNYIIKLL